MRSTAGRRGSPEAVSIASIAVIVLAMGTRLQTGPKMATPPPGENDLNVETIVWKTRRETLPPW